MQKDHEWDMQFERFELSLRKKYPYNFHQPPTYFVEFPKLHLYRHLEGYVDPSNLSKQHKKESRYQIFKHALGKIPILKLDRYLVCN